MIGKEEGKDDCLMSSCGFQKIFQYDLWVREGASPSAVFPLPATTCAVSFFRGKSVHLSSQLIGYIVEFVL